MVESADRLHPLIIPINSHVYISRNKLVFDTEDAQMQLLRNPDVIRLMELEKPEVEVEEIKLRDET